MFYSTAGQSLDVENKNEMKKIGFLIAMFAIVLTSCETADEILVQELEPTIPTVPVGNFTIEPNHNLTFTEFKNGALTGSIVWPITLSSPFIFPVTTTQINTYGNYGGGPDLFSGQAIEVYLGGVLDVPNTCLTFYINNVPVAHSTEPLALGVPILLYYGLPVWALDNIKISIDTNCIPIGFFNIDARNNCNITNVTGIGLPTWGFPINDGRTESQPFTSIEAQTLTVALTGANTGTCLRLYVNGQVYDETPITTDGTYNIDMPAVGATPRDAVILIIWNEC